MGFKVSSEFWDKIKRISDDLRERAKTDPNLKAALDKGELQRKCYKTHEEWAKDSDVHGTIGWYCARCGAWDSYYSFLEYSRYSFMTCDEILAEK